MALLEESRSKSGFVTPPGKFECTHCIMAWYKHHNIFNASHVGFERIEICFGYLKDILIFSPDMETHFKHLKILFDSLRESDLKLKQCKHNFLKGHVQYVS